uniref:C-type lectin domain-containing protein n=1 Tax=Fundulus heteroclitus TaxID=8078 RepID=A0A3Q2QXR8_FUNHE
RGGQLFFPWGQCGFINCHLYQYHYMKEEKTWTEAQQYCREKHTDLATVSNMADMKRLLSNSPGDKMDAWIGLYDSPDVNRTWYWSLAGEEFNESETDWKEGEPSDRGNRHEGTENCGRLQNTPKWDDTGCQWQEYFLCYDGENFHKKTWQKAQSYCREKHTDLVSGLKQLQDGELEKVMESEGNEPPIFIGLFRDSWRWSDGSNHLFVYITSMTDKVILIKESKTWEEALYYCRDHHHDLVTITNLDEQRWVQEKAKKASTDYVWTGLRYTCTLDFWFWVSDEVVSYQNWASERLMDDCDMSGAMKAGGEHQWFKRNDSEEFNFICSNY